MTTKDREDFEDFFIKKGHGAGFLGRTESGIYEWARTDELWTFWRCARVTQRNEEALNIVEPVAYIYEGELENIDCFGDCATYLRREPLPGFLPIYTRPAPDAEAMRDSIRYKRLRRTVCIAGGKFHILNVNPSDCPQNSAIELDAAIDAAIAKGGV